MSDLGTKLKSYRKSRNMTLDQLASALNKRVPNLKITKGRLSRWENNKEEPKLSSLKILADYFNVSLDYLIGLNKNPFPDNVFPIDKESFRKVPLVGTIACGTPTLAEENIEGYVPMFYSSEHKSDVIFALTCKGNSMEPTFKDGDIVFVKQQPTVEDGEVAAVLVDDNEEATLKRIKHVGKDVLLMPDNTSGYSPIVLNSKNPGKILGKVVESRRKFS